jgi:hypothetical protein
MLKRLRRGIKPGVGRGSRFLHAQFHRPLRPFPVIAQRDFPELDTVAIGCGVEAIVEEPDRPFLLPLLCPEVIDRRVVVTLGQEGTAEEERFDLGGENVSPNSRRKPSVRSSGEPRNSAVNWA